MGWLTQLIRFNDVFPVLTVAQDLAASRVPDVLWGSFHPAFVDYVEVHHSTGQDFQRKSPLAAIHKTQIHHLCLGQLQGEVVSQFLRENHFKHFEERDSSGCSPMCYAAMRGDVKILKALLAKKGNPNDKTTTL